MCSQPRWSALALVCLFAVASAVPADAQQRRRSGGASSRSGSAAAPRPAQGSGASAGPRQAQAAGRSGARPAPPPAGSRPVTGPNTGRAVPRPARPAARPGYGYPTHYPANGHRGYYPYYGYRGYYGGYYPAYYWGVGAYYWPYYYSPWFYSTSWVYPAYYAYDEAGPAGGASLKVDVDPKTAEVYVDGFLAGIVDQFDGMFQSLPIEPGEHEITVYQEGYQSIRQRLYLSPGSSQRLKGAMVKLAPGEPNEPRPQRALAPPQDAQVQAAPQYRLDEPQGPPPNRPPPDRPAVESYPPPPADGRYGQVAIRVQPGDAEVLIDGEPWRTQGGSERLVVQLAAGTHRVEIRREGYDPFVTAVEIRRGETAVLNVSLARY